MTEWSDDGASELMARAERAAARAVAAERRADQTEQAALHGPPAVRETQLRLAELYRVNAKVHSTTAAIHRSMSLREASVGEGSLDPGSPLVMAAAQALGVSSVAYVLTTSHGQPADARCSDVRAGSAHDLELLHAEGPMREAAVRGEMVSSEGAEIPQRWPFYGPGLRDLGVGAVAAAPLRARGATFGSVAVFDLTGPGIAVEVVVQHVADLVAFFLMSTTPLPLTQPTQDTAAVDVVHQASGMVSFQLGCDVLAAAALIRGRAFARGEPAHVVAQEVLDGRVRLTL